MISRSVTSSPTQATLASGTPSSASSWSRTWRLSFRPRKTWGTRNSASRAAAAGERRPEITATGEPAARTCWIP